MHRISSLGSRVARKSRKLFSTEPRAARNKAALETHESNKGIVIGTAVLAATSYAVWDINANKNGPLGTLYWGSSLQHFVSDMWSTLMNNLQQNVYLPYTDKILPDFPGSPIYGNVPPGTPAPPLLVVDLEKTLIGSVYDAQHGWRHAKRPGLEKFINALSQYYEIVIISENDAGAVAEVLASIDPESKCHKFGCAVLEIRGEDYIKRLDYMNRDIRKIILIDDNPRSFQGFEANTLQVKPYVDVTDKRDRVLLDLIPLLQAIVHESNERTDFRDVLDNLGTHDAQEAAIEYQVRVSKRKQQEWEKRHKGLGKLLRGDAPVEHIEMESSSVIPTARDLVNGGRMGNDGTVARAPLVAGIGEVVNTELATQALSVPPPPPALVKSGAIEKPKDNAPVVKKKGALFEWLDEASKRNEEHEMRKREKMNELFMKRQMEKMQRAGDSSTDGFEEQ